MKKILFSIIVTFGILLSLHAKSSNNPSTADGTDAKNVFTVQVLKHAFGVDYERKIIRNFGLGLSAGLAGAEIEAKFHFKPQLNSPSIGFATGYTWYSFEDFNDGKSTWETSRINMFFFEYRMPKLLAFTIGAGWFEYKNETKLRMRAGVGFYFPW